MRTKMSLCMGLVQVWDLLCLELIYMVAVIKNKIKPQQQPTTPHLLPVISPMQVLFFTCFQSEINLCCQLSPEMISGLNHKWHGYFKCSYHADSPSSGCWQVRDAGWLWTTPAPAAAGTRCQTALPAVTHLSLVASAPELVCSGAAAAVQSHSSFPTQKILCM